MQLIRDGRFISNDTVETVPLQELETRDFAPGARVATVVDVAADPAELLPWLDRLSLIVVPFAGAGDGRGFSVAIILRRLGYRGELRASGDLIADQYHHLRASGFDSVEISDDLALRHTELDWQKAWQRFPDRYQAAAAGLGSIVAQRHRRADRGASNATDPRRQTKP